MVLPLPILTTEDGVLELQIATFVLITLKFGIHLMQVRTSGIYTELTLPSSK